MRKGLIMFMLAALAGMASAADKPADVKTPMAPKAATTPAPTPAPAPTATAVPAKTTALPAPAPAPAEVAPPAPNSKAKARKRLPRGDMRHCLELKDNAAIIKCSEQRK